VGADNGAERLDHQCVRYRFELASYTLRVGLSVSVADDEAYALAMVDLTRQLDHAIQCAVERAHALEWSHKSVSDAQYRLDLQHRSKQRTRAADAAAAPQEFKRGDGKVRL
jgi:hypothetical protein